MRVATIASAVGGKLSTRRSMLIGSVALPSEASATPGSSSRRVVFMWEADCKWSCTMAANLSAGIEAGDGSICVRSL